MPEDPAAVAFPDWANPDWYDLHHGRYLRRAASLEAFYEAAWAALPGLDERHAVLEVGAGAGRFAAGLIARFPRLGALSLVDIRPERLAAAQARLEALSYRGQVEIIASGLDGLPETTGFDAAVAVLALGEFALELPPERRGGAAALVGPALAALHARLKPGGHLIWGERIDPHGDPSDAAAPRLCGAAALKLLAEARFEAVDCAFRADDLAVYRARRSR